MNGDVAGARRTFTNYRFAQPGRWTRQHEDHFYPTSDFPFTFEKTTDHLTGKTDGLLVKCSASNTCPNVIQVDSYAELYGAHASLIVTDTKGTSAPTACKRAALPAVALASARRRRLHGSRQQGVAESLLPSGASGNRALGARRRCAASDTRPVSRRWHARHRCRAGQELSDDSRSAVQLRRSTRSGCATFPWFLRRRPASTPILVPKLDRDGNMVAGVLVPEVAVPVATYGKAVRKKGFGEGDLCGANGSTIAFAKTKAERLASGDSRLSVEERYPGGQAEYAARNTRAPSTSSSPRGICWPRMEPSSRPLRLCREERISRGRSEDLRYVRGRSKDLRYVRLS